MKKGEDGVGLRHGKVQLCRVRLEECVQSCTNGKEGNANKHTHYAIEQNATACARLVFRCEIALNDGLIARVGY